MRKTGSRLGRKEVLLLTSLGLPAVSLCLPVVQFGCVLGGERPGAGGDSCACTISGGTLSRLSRLRQTLPGPDSCDSQHVTGRHLNYNDGSNRSLALTDHRQTLRTKPARHPPFLLATPHSPTAMPRRNLVCCLSVVDVVTQTG